MKASEWDEEKRASDRSKHGVGFSATVRFRWRTALTVEHVVRGERRLRSIGYIGDRLHVLVWTQRGERLRVISLRRANSREQAAYAALADER